MQGPNLTRRAALFRTTLLAGASLSAAQGEAVQTSGDDPGVRGPAPFKFCLNTATIRGQKLGLAKEIEIAAQAGYQAIEPWVSSIEDYVERAGSLKDLKAHLTDLGLTVESAIAFPEWISDDPGKRSKGMEQAKREMDLVAQLGGKRLAAPPAGATNTPGLDLSKAAERYRELLQAGDQMGVVPQLELWGFSKNLNRLGDCALVAIEAGHPKACILADMFHLYTGGSDHRALSLLSKNAIQVFHLNDYPADPPRDRINDSYRVYPGDGIAPLIDVLRRMKAMGGQTVLSLEVFNRQYWEHDALETARQGLSKMQRIVQRALA